jgi:Tfp pilus assembly major pilin PilA
VWGAVAVLAVAFATTGCAAGEKEGPPSSAAPSGTAHAGPNAAGVVTVSPAGVTTKINVPARSTEEEYFQACHAATTWMQGHPGSRQALVERYLAAVQAPGVAGTGTWNIAWAALPLQRQAAVIVAAQAAVNDECG